MKNRLAIVLLVVGIIAILLGVYFHFKPAPLPQSQPQAVPAVASEPKFSITTSSQFWDMTTWHDGQTFAGAYTVNVSPGSWYNTGVFVKPGIHIIWNYTNGTVGMVDLRIGTRTWGPYNTVLQGGGYYEVQGINPGVPEDNPRLFVVREVPLIEFKSDSPVSIHLETWFNPHWEQLGKH